MCIIQIDGRQLEVPDGITVLEAALQNSIYIPHLCHHPDLPELASCRLCIVEADGIEGVVPSCTLKATEGLNVRTKSEKIDHLRRLAMELILAAHPEDCSTCPKYGRCELQTLIQYMGVSATRVRRRSKGFLVNTENPLLIHDMNRCILCGRCVRACNDLRGVNVLHYNKRELETYVGTLHDRLLKDADCRFCGACAEVCPTGAILDKRNYTVTEKRDVLLPCQATCPVHTDIPRYVRYASKGEYTKAAAVVHERLPFPECLGRVCAHPCEANCRRGEVNKPISIRNIKRFSAEHDEDALWQKNSKHLPATGKKVCVVGGGPAGTAAAFYLAKQGHDVTLKEAMPKLGGQLQYGIPSYRLPRDVVDREMGYATLVGVKVETGTRVERPLELLPEYDAVLMAIGTHNGVRLPIPGNTLPGVILNTDFLQNASIYKETGDKETGLGKRVVVLGGGNVAFDCARTAVRLGAEEVHIACLEARDVMLASEEEIEQAEQEGINVHPAQTFEAICGTEKAEGVRLMNVKSFHFDENRRAIIEKEPDSEHTIAADTVIFAIGQRAQIAQDAGLPLGRGNSIAVESKKSASTSIAGVFACGDAVTGTRTVVEAVAAGRAAASEIDRYLGGDGDISEVLVPAEAVESKIGHVEGFAYQKREAAELIPVPQRRDSFIPIDRGLCAGGIGREAARCLQCDLRFRITLSRTWGDYSNAETEAAR